MKLQKIYFLRRKRCEITVGSWPRAFSPPVSYHIKNSKTIDIRIPHDWIKINTAFTSINFKFEKNQERWTCRRKCGSKITKILVVEKELVLQWNYLFCFYFYWSGILVSMFDMTHKNDTNMRLGLKRSTQMWHNKKRVISRSIHVIH